MPCKCEAGIFAGEWFGLGHLEPRCLLLREVTGCDGSGEVGIWVGW